MTSGAVKMEFPVTTINEAMLLATERWRVLMEEPEATLPWSTHLNFVEQRMDSGTLQMMCVVLIEFDRKVIDELTGAHMSAEPGEPVKTV